jgi:Fur family zinc uptake transcriptional regulator
MVDAILAFPKRGSDISEKIDSRPTGMRALILELLRKADKPVAAYWLIDSLRTRGKRVAPPTIYRALNALQRAGLAHKIESQSAFAACRHPEHAHQSQFLVCSQCGQAEELADHDFSMRMQASAEAKGFLPVHQIIEVIGLCAACIAQGARPDAD